MKRLEQDFEISLSVSACTQMNMSKFHILTNRVIEHPTELISRQGIHELTWKAVQTGKAESAKAVIEGIQDK